MTRGQGRPTQAWRQIHDCGLDACDIVLTMKIMTLTRGGQVSIPAAFRRGWTTNRVMVRETPEGLLLRPVPDDPLSAAIGSLADIEITSEESIRQLRQEEAEIEKRKYGHLFG
jgi:bifunctional DNA-binding transcriptional regulator/antitoxin component of YhaV-PrlF toxin-antitoxin module